MTHKQEKPHPIETEQDRREKIKLSNKNSKASVIHMFKGLKESIKKRIKIIRESLESK